MSLVFRCMEGIKVLHIQYSVHKFLFLVVFLKSIQGLKNKKSQAPKSPLIINSAKLKILAESKFSLLISDHDVWSSVAA